MNFSIRQAAEQLGISHTALRKRIGAGKVTWPAVSIESLKAEWERNRDTNHPPPITRVPAPTEAPSALRPTLPPGVPSQAISSAREAALRVEERAFRVAQRKGILLDSGEVRASWSGMISVARNRLLLVPEQVCDAVAAEADPIRCREIVAGAIYDALSSLKNYVPQQH